MGQGGEPAAERQVLEHLLQPRVRDAGVEHGQVVPQARSEQLDVLGDHPDVIPEVVDLADGDAAQAHLALLRLVQPDGQLGQRRLARPGPPDDAEGPAGGDLDRDPPQDGTAVVLVGVGEGDALEAQAQRAGGGGTSAGRGHGGAHGLQPLDPGDGPAGLLQLLHLLAELRQRSLDHPDVDDDEEDPADRHRAARRRGRADDEHRDGQHAEQRLAGDPHDGEPAPPLHGAGQDLAGLAGEAGLHEPARAVGDDVLGAADQLADLAVQLGVGGAERRPPGHDDAVEASEGQHADREPDTEDEAEEPRLERDQHDDADDQQAVADHLHDERGEERGEGRDVTVDPLDQVAGRAGGVEGHVLGQDVCGEGVAQAVGGPPADLLGQGGGDDGGAHRQQGQDDDAGGQREQLGPVASRQRPVDDALDELRGDQLQADADEQGDREQRDAPPETVEVGGDQ